MGGELVTSGMSSLILYRKCSESKLLYSGGLVQNLSNCRGLYWSCPFFVCIISCMILMSSETSLGKARSLYLLMNWSISLVSYGSEENYFFLLKSASRSEH